MKVNHVPSNNYVSSLLGPVFFNPSCGREITHRQLVFTLHHALALVATKPVGLQASDYAKTNCYSY